MRLRQAGAAEKSRTAGLAKAQELVRVADARVPPRINARQRVTVDEGAPAGMSPTRRDVIECEHAA